MQVKNFLVHRAYSSTLIKKVNTYNALPVITIITIKSGAVHWSMGTSDDPWSILPRVDFLCIMR